MLLSIVIPTEGRRALLWAAIDSCLAQALPDGAEAEIVVVDNTPQGLLESRIAAYATPRLRWVHAPSPGIAQARNAGVAAARGCTIAFLDDDQRAMPGWAAALLWHTRNGAAVVFGPIEPRFEAPPAVCAEAATRLFGRSFPLPDGGDVTAFHAYLSTGNVLFDRARCFTTATPFDEDLSGLGGEDSAFFHRLAHGGLHFVWAADARIEEHLPTERITLAKLATRHFRNGQIRSLVRFRAPGLAKLEGLAWMGIGAVQAALFGAASLACAAFDADRAVLARLKAWGGVGKILWQRPFWQITYGPGAAGRPAEASHPLAAPRPEPPFVSILVVNYRTRELTLECLRSIVRETRTTRYEIVLVDNASSDGLVDAARREFPHIRLVALAENVGFARANNIAAEAAAGDHLLLLNPDTVVLDGAIDRLVDFARRRPQAGIWGGRTLYGDRSLNPTSCYRRMTPWNVFCRSLGLTALLPSSPLFNSEAYGGWDRASEREVDIVTGCFLLIGCGLWQRLGGFDPAFFMYGEEADLCLRARHLGARPAVTPHATIVHYGGASEQPGSEKTIRLLTAKAELIKRHWPAPIRQLGLMLFALGPLTRLIATRLVAQAPGGNAAQADTWWSVWQDRARWRLGYR